MKRLIRALRCFAFAPLLFCAAEASAAGINLGWNDCPSGPTYSLVQTFACNTNMGTHTLVASFVPVPYSIEAMSANEVVIDMITGGAQLASWWTFGAGQCRTAASLAGNFDFTAGPFTCFDYWQGGAIGALSWSLGPSGGANRCRIKGVFALPLGDPRITSIPPDVEVYSFKAVINSAKTIGLGACAGCSDEACIVLDEITINQPAPNPPRTPLNAPQTMANVLWQGWNPSQPSYSCPSAVPTRTRTWGSIKALYR